MQEIAAIRKHITAVDKRILEALARRRRLVARIVEAKDRTGAPIRDTRREEQLLEELIAQGRRLGLDAHFILRVFGEILEDSLRAQKRHFLADPDPGPQRVAYQGIPGAYSEAAARRHFAPFLDRTSFVGLATFQEVVEAVEAGEAEYGILPLENTTAGSINEVYDLLSCARLAIVGEVIFQVDHCLVSLREVPLTEIDCVLSHPQALSQCLKFLSRLPHCEVRPFPDTAMAVKRIKEEANPRLAAIASEEAARLYGVHVLRRNVQDQRENFTRFVVVGKKSVPVDARVPCTTSLVMAVPHEAGALLKALSVLHQHDINLLKLESRPIPGLPFQYRFYLDMEGNTLETRIATALAELRRVTTSLTVLGCYPSQHHPRTKPPVPPPQPGADVAEATPSPSPSPATSKPPYPLVWRGSKPEGTVVLVRGVRIGGEACIVMAGPCAVESREQIRQCAQQVRECGAHMLRGGCFKPRTSPYSFQGLGLEGLQLLAEAGAEFDLPIVTEVLSPADVDTVARYADLLQIGARNMQNFSLLAAVGRCQRPVLLKRGMMSTIDEFLSAAEYILAQGNHQVVLCERGIRTFETMTRNTLDLGAIPILKRLTHLPIVVDPSHAAGRRDLVAPLALAARAVGCHGLLVEIHPNPETALSDGPQALPFAEFAALMRALQGG
jgi:chorismate mutase/prephenate dehydratase